jgi:hypothetical protein
MSNEVCPSFAHDPPSQPKSDMSDFGDLKC